MIADSEDILLSHCKNLIEDKLGWGNSTLWVNQDFEELSQHIFDVTSVTLSPTTLKRIWGRVKYDSAPTKTTLNTLAQYIGFENWRVYRQNHLPNNNGSTHEVPASQPKALPVTKRPYLLSFILPLLLLSGAVSWYLFSRKDVNISTQLNPDDYQFSSKKVISTGIPNSVVFDYDASNAPDDSVYIQQSWDPTKKVRVSRNQRQHTSIYYSPGFFQAKLIVRNQVVKEHNLFIQTEGWLPMIEQAPVPVYLKQEEVMNDGKMGIPIEDLRAKNISLHPIAPTVQYINLKDFGDIETNDFIFETTVKNTYCEGTSVCQYTQIGLICEGTAILIRLSAKGCVSENNLFFAGQSISGKEHDLSGFGVDFSDFASVRCESVDGLVRIFVNDQLAYSCTYKGAPSKIVGITYGFQGAGLVDAVTLSKGDGKLVYVDTFGK